MGFLCWSPPLRFRHSRFACIPRHAHTPVLDSAHTAGLFLCAAIYHHRAPARHAVLLLDVPVYILLPVPHFCCCLRLGCCLHSPLLLRTLLLRSAVCAHARARAFALFLFPSPCPLRSKPPNSTYHLPSGGLIYTHCCFLCTPVLHTPPSWVLFPLPAHLYVSHTHNFCPGSFTFYFHTPAPRSATCTHLFSTLPIYSFYSPTCTAYIPEPHTPGSFPFLSFACWDRAFDFFLPLTLTTICPLHTTTTPRSRRKGQGRGQGRGRDGTGREKDMACACL